VAVSLFSALPLGKDESSEELDAGALHRYLAEAVWYPVALLPGCGVTWQSLDDNRALASLTLGKTRVSLEFRFNDRGEVESVYTPARYQKLRKGFRLAPWEGRFRDYREIDGLRVPFRAEAGWYGDDGFQPVWQGRIEDIRREPEKRA